MDKYGSVKIKLNDLIIKSGLSKSKFAQRAEMQRTQLNKFCKNEVTRLDTDVLARICTVLNCEISDVLEFIPPEKEE